MKKQNNKKLLFALSALALVGVGSASAQSAMDIRRGRMAINLRQAGMPPEMVKWAVWASEHKPYTTCAQYADRIDGMMNSPDGDQTGYIPVTIIPMENSGVCRQTVLAKAKPPRQYLEEQKKRDELFDSYKKYEPKHVSCLNVRLGAYSKDVMSHAHVNLKCHIVKKKDGYLHTEKCSILQKSGDSEFVGDVFLYLQDKCWDPNSPPSSLKADGTADLGFDFDRPSPYEDD